LVRRDADSSAIEAIDTEVTATMKAQLDTAGLPVKLLDLPVGRANPPACSEAARCRHFR
jgi:hypothetical protein